MVIKGKTKKESEQTMGMAASQARLLQLTSRENTIGRNLSSLSLQKQSLARDQKRITKEYQEALNSKVLKWSNNSGVSYVDLSYSNLMSPSTANQNTPYLITDSNGKIVIDSKYEDYAKMIDENGGKYDDNVRAKILSGLIKDISESDITTASTNSAAKTAAEEKVKELEKKEPEEPTDTGNAVDIAKLIGSVSISETETVDISNYTSGTITLGNADSAKTALEKLQNNISGSMSQYLGTEGTNAEAWSKACETYFGGLTGLFDNDKKSTVNDT